MEVSKSWNYFIKSERVMQKAYKAHKAYKQRIEDIIQGLTDFQISKPSGQNRSSLSEIFRSRMGT